MQKVFVFIFLVLAAAPVFCQDAKTIDFVRNLNEGLNEKFSGGHFLKTAMDSGNIPFLPGMYLSRKQSTYVTFGLMVNNPETETQDPSLDEVLKNATLLKAAILVRRYKTNVILFFDYYQNGHWGLSLKLKY